MSSELMSYHLIIVQLISDERTSNVEDKVFSEISRLGLEIHRGLVLSWRGRDEIERRLYKIKEYLISRFEKEGAGPKLVYSVIELTSDQYNALRPLISESLEAMCERLIRRIERLMSRVRSSGGREVSEIRREYDRVRREFRELVDLHRALDVRHGVLDRLVELMRALSVEIYKRL